MIHIVGPIVSGRLTKDLEQDLADCYRNTLDLCLENGIRSVAFCCISTGVFRFPNRRAAEIAVKTVTDWLDEHSGCNERAGAAHEMERARTTGASASRTAHEMERARTAGASASRTAHEMERVIFNVFKDEDKAYYEAELQ